MQPQPVRQLLPEHRWPSIDPDTVRLARLRHSEYRRHPAQTILGAGVEIGCRVHGGAVFFGADVLSRDPAPPPVSYIKSSGGLFRDMMTHDLDMARLLHGEEVVRVFATGSALVDPEIGEAGDVDTAVAVLNTPFQI